MSKIFIATLIALLTVATVHAKPSKIRSPASLNFPNDEFCGMVTKLSHTKIEMAKSVESPVRYIFLLSKSNKKNLFDQAANAFNNKSNICAKLQETEETEETPFEVTMIAHEK